jgi:tetratricopeptide (TPR) repeat protein
MKFVLRLLLPLLWVHASIQRAGACIWYDGTTLEGNFTRTEPARKLSTGALLKEEPAYIPGNRFRFSAEQLRAAIAFKPEEFLSFYTYTDKLPPGWPEGMDEAVRLIFAGKAAEAVTRLTELDRATPDNYWICANLGAACELSGDLPAALRWVEKALTINPGAHEGTEWMHAAVIRARLALEKDPAWLETHTVSGIPIEGDVPRDFDLTERGRHYTLNDIHRALMAHTFTRLIFVKPKDAVAAALLTELARVEARLIAMENGIALLGLAKEYGAGTADLSSRWEALKPGPLVAWFRKNTAGAWVIIIALALVCLAIGYYFLRRRQTAKRLSTPAPGTGLQG